MGGTRRLHGVRLRVRPDHRRYSLTLRTEGLLGGEDDDLYRANLPLPPAPGEWLDLRIPYCAFALTSRGYVQSPRPMDLEHFEAVGVLLADGESGEFALELAEMGAFRFSDEEVHRDLAVQRMLDLNSQLGYPAY